MDHVILTVGLNEIPVLVAAYRLCRVAFERKQKLPRFSVLCSRSDDENKTAGSDQEALRVKRLLEEKLRQEQIPGGLRWDLVYVVPDHPRSVREQVAQVISEAGPHRDYTFHLNYTGGRAAMGVHAAEVLVEQRGDPVEPRYQYETSYLSGDEYTLFDRDDRALGGVTDERLHWNLQLEDLIKLHGYKFYGGCKPDKKPDAKLIDLGCRMAEILADETNNGEYGAWLRSWAGNKGKEIRWPGVPDPRWPALVEDLARYFPQYLGLSPRSFRVPPSKKQKRTFFHYECLELLAYRELKAALSVLEIRQRTRVYHSVECVPEHTERQHEIDVIALRGYELVAVSCSMAAGEKRKQKVFEVLHRARQIAGTNARGIVLCAETKEAAAEIEAEVADDVGGRLAPPAVWGRDCIENPAALRDKFIEYFESIKWGTRQ